MTNAVFCNQRRQLSQPPAIKRRDHPLFITRGNDQIGGASASVVKSRMTAASLLSVGSDRSYRS